MKHIPLLITLFLASCVGTRTAVDPTVTLLTSGGTELGVSTDYGVVFLGPTARSGPVQMTVWFGDGPSIESSIIEPVGGGIFTAEAEISLPLVALDFTPPAADETLIIAGRNEYGPWEAQVTAFADPRVWGPLLSIPSQLIGRANQVGAGVYRDGPGGRRLVGLVSGRLRLAADDGSREYLTVVGPAHLWRMVTHRKDAGRRRPWVYREDIL